MARSVRAGQEERLQRLSRLMDTLLGLDLITFCYLLHVAQVASWASGKSAHGGVSNALPEARPNRQPRLAP